MQGRDHATRDELMKLLPAALRQFLVRLMLKI